MRTIAIINQKGGCGKTTTSINLAACLARLGQKTLLVDMDPQGHCAVGLAVPEEQIERTIYDCLLEDRDGKPARLADIVWQIATDFDLAPSNLKLAAFEQVFAGRIGREDRLKKAVESVGANYKWCIIDCPPSVGLITFNALRACDEAIVPVETGYFSLHGLAKMMETLEMLRDRCNKEILIRVLPTLYDTRTKLAREVLSELRNKFREYLMDSTVNFNTKLKEAASFGQPITEYDPGSRGYKDFVNLARELMGHTPLESEPTPMDKLTRPQELVQRAKQLAQLTNLQFGRNAVPANPPASQPDNAVSPMRIDPMRIDPTRIEPARIEPARLEPARLEPARVEPARMEPARPETPLVNSVRIDPSRINSARMDAPRMDSARTESSRIEPSRNEPSRNEPSRGETSRIDSPQGGYSRDKVSPGQIDTPAAGSLTLSLSRGPMQLSGRISQDFMNEAVGAAISLSSEEEEMSDSAPISSPRMFSNTPGNTSAGPSTSGNAGAIAGAGGHANGHGNFNISTMGNSSSAGGVQHMKIVSSSSKTDDFWGVKRVGDEVIFAARFDRAKKVLIAGDFNNWSPMSTPMISRGKPGEFYMSLPLPAGRYRYRFVVDGKWMTDPHNKYVEVNQFGELNNVIEVE